MMASSQIIVLRQILKQMMQQQGMGRTGSDTDYAVLRDRMENAASAMPVEPGTSLTPEVLASVEVERVAPANLTGSDIVFYIHGGGFTTLNARSSRVFASQLASEAGLTVYTITYRLAPEHPFPAAVDDCFAVYTALLDRVPHHSIALIGDSAGANLALVTAFKARQAGLRLPSSIILYSPPVDLTGAIDHSKHAATDFMISESGLTELREIYYPGHDPSDPFISPRYGEYQGFPPMKIVSDSAEILAEDALLLAEKARQAGVEVDFQVWDETFHAFAVAGKATPESDQVLKETARFIKTHFNRDSQ